MKSHKSIMAWLNLPPHSLAAPDELYVARAGLTFGLHATSGRRQGAAGLQGAEKLRSLGLCGDFEIVPLRRRKGYCARFKPLGQVAAWRGPALPNEDAARRWIKAQTQATEAVIEDVLMTLARLRSRPPQALAQAWIGLADVRYEFLIGHARQERLGCALEWLNIQVFEGGVEAFCDMGPQSLGWFFDQLYGALHEPY